MSRHSRSLVSACFFLTALAALPGLVHAQTDKRPPQSQSAAPPGAAGAADDRAPRANPPPPPRVEPTTPEPPPPIGFSDDTLERAIQVIPDVESREERVVDGKRTVHVKTKSGAEYVLTEDDGVAVTTLLQPETQRLRVPKWILLEW